MTSSCMRLRGLFRWCIIFCNYSEWSKTDLNIWICTHCRKMLTIAFDSNTNDVAVLKYKIPDNLFSFTEHIGKRRYQPHEFNWYVQNFAYKDGMWCHINFIVIHDISAFHDIMPHDGVMKWKHFQRYWPFVRGIHRSPVNSPQRPVTRSFDVFFDLHKRLRK